ncbi:MAG: hypothetical protein ACRCZO_02730, partial [Cetobacterium sp.]
LFIKFIVMDLVGLGDISHAILTILNAILRGLSVNYGSVYSKALHLKAGDGDLAVIRELALLTKCA